MPIEGVDRLFDNLERIIDKTSAQELKSGFIEIAKPIQRQVQNYARPHYKTGRLDANIFVTSGNPDKSDVIVGVSFKNAPEGMWLEYGTSRQPARPFFHPAVVSMIGDTARALVTLFQRVIGQAIK